MLVRTFIISAVRQRSLPDVGSLVLRHNLHDPGPDHRALPRGVPAPQVQGALQGQMPQFHSSVFQDFVSVNFIYKEVLSLCHSSHGYIFCPQHSQVS